MGFQSKKLNKYRIIFYVNTIYCDRLYFKNKDY